MKKEFNKIERYLTEAKKAFDSELYDSVATSMRKVAEVLAPFYIDFYKLYESYEYMKEISYAKKEFLICIYTLQKHTSLFSDRFDRDLTTFLWQARKFGNASSHPDDAIEKWEAKYLICYFEKYILNQFISDYKKNNTRPEIIDVTTELKGTQVCIYSIAAEKYACAMENIDGPPIYCITDHKDAWETYTVEIDKDGMASFKASNGKYLSIDKNENESYPPIKAIGPRSCEWEKFRIYKFSDYFAIKSMCNEKWITCRIDWDNAPLYAAADSIALWEEFDIVVI